MNRWLAYTIVIVALAGLVAVLAATSTTDTTETASLASLLIGHALAQVTAGPGASTP